MTGKTATEALTTAISSSTDTAASSPKAPTAASRWKPMTNLSSQLVHAAGKLFDRIAGPELLVRRITITANRVTEDAGVYQLNLFTNTRKLEAEKRLQSALAGIKEKVRKKRRPERGQLPGRRYNAGTERADRRPQGLRRSRWITNRPKMGRMAVRKYGDILNASRPVSLGPASPYAGRQPGKGLLPFRGTAGV